MPIAALYDIHGNLPALEAVLREVDAAGVDQVVVGGDVFPGPMAGECLERLLELELPVEFIRGNGDRQVLALAEGAGGTGVPEAHLPAMRWEAERLDAEHRRRMARWPATLTMKVDGFGEAFFCHATPRNDTEIFTRSTPDERLAPVFDGVGGSLVVCGHTHMQFDRRLGDLRVVNAGSVGMPFGEPGAYWLIVGPELELRRTPYDLDRAARRIRSCGHPGGAEFAARNIANPPSEREMLEAFAAAELS